jgi:Tol biopolymer transport system component
MYDVPTGQLTNLTQGSGAFNGVPRWANRVFLPAATPTPTPTPLPPVIQITVPPTDNAPITTTDQTRFQAVAYNPAVGTTDGAGIQQVEFEIRDSTNALLYSFTDTTAAYCAFGGGSPCSAAPGPISSAAPGTYMLLARAKTTGGVYTAWVPRPFVMGGAPTNTPTPTKTNTPTSTPVGPTPTPTKTSTPTSTPVPSNQIVFSSDRDGNNEIYKMDATGSNPVRLTNNAASDVGPVWSPDRAHIAFASNRDGNYELYVMNADGTGQTRLTNNAADDGNAVWSPDGSKLAFVSRRDGNDEIYVLNADASLTRLTNNTADDLFPSWSPDGAKIAFTSTRDGNSELYVMNATGSSQTRLTTNSALDAVPAYSPDGSKIAFVSERDGNDEIYVMNADGSGTATRLTTNTAADGLYVSSTIYFGLSWSADGSQLVFMSNRDSNLEIYSMNATGSSQTRLTTNSVVDAYPDW